MQKDSNNFIPEKLITGKDAKAVGLLRQIFTLLRDSDPEQIKNSSINWLKEIERAYKTKKSSDTVLLNALDDLLNEAYELLNRNSNDWQQSKEQLYVVFERIVFLKARESVFNDYFDKLESTFTSTMLLDFSKRVPFSQILTQEGNIFDYASAMVNSLVEKLEESVVSAKVVNTILTNLPNSIIVVTDKTGKIRFINSLGEMILGASRYDFLNQSIHSIFLNYDSIEKELGTNGHIKQMNVSVNIKQTNAPAVLTVVKAKSEVVEIEEFVYTIHLDKISSPSVIDLRREMHDKIAPLNSILGIVELMNDRIVHDPEARQLSDLAKNLVLRLKHDSIFQLQVISGQIENEKDQFIDVSELIDETIESLRYNEGFNEVTITQQIETDFFTKKMLFRSTLQNLLSNAIKYRKRNTKNEIHIRFTKSHSERFLLEIKDTGIGIKKEEMDNIFINSYASSKNMEGLGSGLAIVKENLQKLDGEIRISSEYGRGSVFSVIFHKR